MPKIHVKVNFETYSFLTEAFSGGTDKLEPCMTTQAILARNEATVTITATLHTLT